MAVLQSRDGCLWVGTANGLARFDGVRFRTYGMAEGLPSLLVRILIQARDGAIWVGTANGLARYYDGRFTTWTAREGLAGDSIMALAEDREGAIWVGTTAGLNRWRGGALETMGKEPAIAGRYVRALLADQEGGVWVSVAGAGLFRWNGQSFVSVAIPAQSERVPPYCLLKDRTGRIWAGAVGRIFYRRGNSWEVYGPDEGLPNVRIVTLAEGRDGRLWAGTLDEGLYWLSGERWQRLPQTTGLSDQAVQAVLADRERNLWIGTRSGGLNRLKTRQLSMWTIRDGETEVAPMSLAEAPDGALWVASLGRAFYRFDAKERGRFVREPLEGSLAFGALVITRDGSLWWGAVSRLSHWRDGKLLASYADEPWLRGDAVRSLCEDREEGLWIGTRSGRLLLYRNGGFTAFTNGVPRTSLSALVQERDGTLWIGSYGGGLGRLKGGSGTIFGPEQGLRSGLIRALCLDAKENLWIGTEGGGLGCFKDGTIRSFGPQQGIAADTIVQILEDSAGNLWLGTFHGIFQVFRGDLEDLLAGRTSQVHPRVFGRSDGMRSEQCAVGFGTCLRRRNGALCFSTDKGIAVVDPQARAGSGTVPDVQIEEVLIDGVPHPMRVTAQAPNESRGRKPACLVIAPGKQRLEIRYTGLYYAAPERVRFRYRLAGLDSDWVEAGGERVAVYTHVPPGRYRFEVIAHNGNGVWSQPPVALAITAEPHYWQTWWFRLSSWAGAAGSISGAGLYIMRRRHRARLGGLEQQHAIDRERARIAQDMHDELGSRLTKASMVADRARRESAQSPVLQQNLQVLRETLGQMTTRMDELVWAVNPRHDTLDGLASYAVRYTQEFLADTPVNYVLNIPTVLPAVPLTAQVRHNLFLAFEEALTNVVRHSAATEVAVSLEFDGRQVHLEVKDNGSGFSLEKVGAGEQGLQNMRDRLRAAGGQCDVESKPGHGTRVRFELPLPG